jgi:predicted RNase H-like nuclease
MMYVGIDGCKKRWFAVILTEEGDWDILRKIREVDNLLINREFAKSRVRETHPEICFWAMAGHPIFQKYQNLIHEVYAWR